MEERNKFVEWYVKENLQNFFSYIDVFNNLKDIIKKYNKETGAEFSFTGDSIERGVLVFSIKDALDKRKGKEEAF
jgi:hypothetical protein